jgi:DNA-binding beta-propeller fold protein YncE
VSDEIVAVSTATKAILDTLQRSGLSPSDIVLNAAGDRAYVFMGDTTTSSLIDTMWVDVVDLSTGAALENLPLPGPVYGPVFPPSGDFIYVFSDRAVHVLSTVSVSIERTLSSDRVDGGVRSAVIP